MPSAATPIRRGERGGVPLLWLDADGDPEVALVFRVGMVDEPYARSGMTHLVEHLALEAVGEPTHPWNGWVSIDQTAFTARGTVDEVVRYLEAVVAALASLPVDRLDHERGVLEVEAAESSPDLVAHLLQLRYGLAAPGRRGSPELALRAASPAALQAWADERFTREAAVLCWIGPEPPELSLALPTGSPPPVPPAPTPIVPLPFAVPGDDDGIALAMTTPRAIVSTVFRLVLRRRLQDELRGRRGLLYSVDSTFDVLTGGVMHVAFTAQTRAGAAPEAMGVMLDEFARLVDDGCTAEEVQAACKEISTSLPDDDAREAMLAEAALQLVCGADVLDDAPTLLAELDAVTPEAVTALARDARRTMVVLVPPSAAVPGAPFVSPDDVPEPSPVQGRTFRTRSLPGLRAHLDIGDDGITIRDSAEDATTLRWADVVAVEPMPDGTLRLTAADTTWCELELQHVKDGDEVRRLIEAAVDPAVFVPQPGAEHADAVRAVADRDLSAQWMTKAELAQLPAELEPGEEVLRLCAAMHAKQAGLVAVTDRRTVFLGARLSGDVETHEVRHAALRGATSDTSRVLRNHRLRLDARPDPRTYWGFTRQRVPREVAELLRRLAGGPDLS